MTTTLRTEFDLPGVVKSAVELSGRGITFLCRQLDGTFCYSVTEAAKSRLMKTRTEQYTNSNGQVVTI